MAIGRDHPLLVEAERRQRTTPSEDHPLLKEAEALAALEPEALAAALAPAPAPAVPETFLGGLKAGALPEYYGPELKPQAPWMPTPAQTEAGWEKAREHEKLAATLGGETGFPRKPSPAYIQTETEFARPTTGGWPAARAQAEKRQEIAEDLPWGGTDILPPADAPFSARVGQDVGMAGRGLVQMLKTGLVDAPLAIPAAAGALAREFVPRQRWLPEEVREYLPGYESTRGKAVAAKQAAQAVGRDIKYRFTQPLESLSRAPLSTPMLAAAPVFLGAGAAQTGAQTARIAGQVGARAALQAAARGQAARVPFVRHLAKRMPAGWLEGQPPEAVSAMLRPPEAPPAGLAGVRPQYIAPAAERVFGGIRRGAGLAAAAPFQAAMTLVSPQSRAALTYALAKKLGPWAVSGRGLSQRAIMAFLRPTDIEAAAGRVNPAVAAAAEARRGTLGQGAKAAAETGVRLEEAGAAPDVITGKVGPAWEVGPAATELNPEALQARLAAEARATEPVQGVPWVRRKTLGEAYAAEGVPPPITQEAAGFGIRFVEIDDAGVPTGKTWKQGETIPPGTKYKQEFVFGEPEAPPVVLSGPGENLPALQTEGVGVSRYAPTVLKPPAAVPQIEPVGAPGLPLPFTGALPKAAPGTLPPPGAVPPPRTDFPVMPPPGFSAVEKARMLATGEAVPLPPPTLKAPPPVPRGGEFTMQPPRPEVAPLTPAQRLAGTIVPEVTPAGAAEIPSLKPGMEVKTRIRGLEAPGERPSPPIETPRAIVPPGTQAAIKAMEPAHTFISQAGDELAEAGIIPPTQARRGHYLQTEYDEALLKASNPEAWRKAKAARGEARAKGELFTSEQEHWLQRPWGDLPAEELRKRFGMILEPLRRVTHTVHDMADMLARKRFFDELAPQAVAAEVAPGPGWMRVPDIKAPGGGPLYGKMAGKWVPPEVHNAAEAIYRMSEVGKQPGVWHDLMMAWKNVKLIPPFSIATSARNLESYATTQQALGRIGLFDDKVRRLAVKIANEWLHEGGPHRRAFEAAGGGSRFIDIGAQHAGAKLSSGIVDSFRTMGKDIASAIARGSFRRLKLLADPEIVEAQGVRGLVQRFNRSEMVQRGRAIYTGSEQIQKNLGFSVMEDAQKTYKAGGAKAQEIWQETARNVGPDDATRLLSGGPREALEWGEFTTFNYDDISAFQRGVLSFAPFDIFRSEAANLFKNFLQRHPAVATAVTWTGDYLTRLTWALYWDDPTMGPEDARRLSADFGPTLPLGTRIDEKGNRKVQALPLRGWEALSSLIPPAEEFETVGPGSEFLASLAQQSPAVQAGLALLPALGGPRVRLSGGPPIIGTDITPAFGEQVEALPWASKVGQSALDLFGVVAPPLLYHGVKAKQAIFGPPSPRTGEKPSLLGAALGATVGLKPFEYSPEYGAMVIAAKAASKVSHIRALRARVLKMKGWTPEQKQEQLRGLMEAETRILREKASLLR